MILHDVSLGAGPPIVLLHGLFGSAQSFGTVQRRLSERFRVVALDLRNHGASPHAAGMGYAALAQDVAETFAAAGLPACPVIGHSMGGKVAMRLALDRPDLVASLLVSDIAPVRYEVAFTAYAAAMARLTLTPALTRAAADAALAPDVPEPSVRAFLLQNLRFGAAPSWRIGLAEIASAMDEIGDWPVGDARFSGPTLFVAGATSDYIRPEHRPAIQAQFPRARLVTVKQAGHWVHADNLAGFLAVVDAFLAVPEAG